MADQVKREIALTQEGAHPLASWGDPQVIDQIVRRLRSMLPNSSKLSDDQILAGAQRALLEGKNPFNGELYISDRVGVVDGYRGIQKDADPSRFYTQTRQMTPDEREEHALGQQDIGYVCLLWDFEKKRRCDDLGIPYEPTKGIGIVFSHERQKSHAPVGRTWAWVAQKRAYKDALRMSGLPGINVGVAGRTAPILGRAGRLGEPAGGARQRGDRRILSPSHARGEHPQERGFHSDHPDEHHGSPTDPDRPHRREASIRRPSTGRAGGRRRKPDNGATFAPAGGAGACLPGRTDRPRRVGRPVTAAMQIRVAKYDPLREDLEADDTVIEITESIPDFASTLEASRWYDEQAAKIAIALQYGLPRATFERLVAELLRRAATVYRGRCPGGDDPADS